MTDVLVNIGIVLAGAFVGTAFGLLEYGVRGGGNPDGLFKGRDNWKFHAIFGGLCGVVTAIVGLWRMASNSPFAH